MLPKALLAAILTLASAAACSSHRPPFPPLQDEPAALAARDPDRIVVLVFTANWCGPCLAMQHESWPDPNVTEWANRYATLRTVDIDDDPDTTARYGVRGIPTLVAIGSERGEIARTTGFLAPPELLDFLERSRAGMSRLQQLEARLRGAEADAAPAANVEILREAVRIKDWPRAARAWDEAWNARARLDPEDRFRMLALSPQIGPHSGEATEALRRARRDLEAPAVTPSTPVADPELALEWVQLSLALGEAEVVASWYAAAPDDPTQRGVLHRGYLTLWSAFVAAKRPADLIRLFTADDPVRHAESAMNVEIIRLPGAPMISRNQVVRWSLPRLVDLYGACVATGRTDDAAGVRAVIESRFAASSVRADLDAAPARFTPAKASP